MTWPAPTPTPQDDLREFLAVLYRALRGITAYLERKYGFGSGSKE